VTGSTYSDESTFPVQIGPGTVYGGGGDAFVAKLHTNGAKLYCGYIGGSGLDSGMDIEVGIAGTPHVVGYTNSDETSFPVAVGPDLTHNGDFDAFVATVHSAGMGLNSCGYIGGAGDDKGFGVAIDDLSSYNCTFVSGGTLSDEASFPVTVGPDLTYNGGSGTPFALGDAFVAKVHASQQSLTFCGYLGGAADEIGQDIAVDANGTVFLTGGTSSPETSFPVLSGPELTYDGFTDGFIARIQASGMGLDYCGVDSCYAIALGSDGAAYVAGTTKSGAGSLPVTPHSLDVTHNGSWDAFVAKVIDPSMLWCDVYVLPATTGGTISFTLDAGIANQNRQYLLLGSLSGTDPGILLPGGLATLPLNWDAFTDLILGLLNSYTFSNFMGVLDGNGRATAQLNLGPVPPGYVGIPIWFAFTLGNPFDVVSNPAYIFIVD